MAVATAPESSFAFTGLARFVVVPSPSSPCALYPQQKTAPAAVRAQTWVPPPGTEIATTPLRPVETGAGLVIDVRPFPNSPSAPAPQHHTAPPLVRAHVKLAPAATATAPLRAA